LDRLAGRDLALDNIEKADEFEVAVALHAEHCQDEQGPITNSVSFPLMR
jgi:hypothetical protein